MKRIFLSVLCAVTGALILASCSKKPAATTTTTPGVISFPWDSGEIAGPEAIIAKYPAKMKNVYFKTMKTECSACHPIARYLYAPYFKGKIWDRIVYKMATRPGSPVTASQVPEILKFVKYDHTQRKTEILQQFTASNWQKVKPYQLPPASQVPKGY